MENIVKNETFETKEDVNLIKNDIDHLNVKLEKELLDTIISFMNEIELVFEYVKNINQLNKYVNELKTNRETFLNFIKESLNVLSIYEDKIYKINNTNKLKSIDFEFLNKITLFNNMLNFSVFKDENKSTKKNIVKYIYTIYISSFILNFGIVNTNGFLKEDDLMGFVNDLTDKLQKIEDNKLEKINKKNKKTAHQNSTSFPTGDLLGNLGNLTDPSSLNNLNGIFQSLMSNNEIMSIATDLSKDIRDENIDPMSLLSSIMSGKPNDKLNKLVSNITNKIETKIENGEINKDILEEQAKSIMESLQKK